MSEALINRTVKILLIIFLVAMILYFGRPFLVPLTFAALLAMLMLPVSTKLESWGVHKVLAIILSILLIVIFFAGVVALLAWQVSDLSEQAPQIEKNINEKVQQVREYLTNSLGISEKKQNEIIEQQQASSDSKLSSMLSGALSKMGTLLTNFLIVMVYVFLFLYFRMHLRKFVLKLVPSRDQKKANEVIDNSRKVAQKYIAGLMLMIVGLWILYSIGFGLVGVKNFVFFAILCGLLEIVPFVGNLLGNAITIIVTLAQGGSMNVVIGILIVYAVVQFFQSYVLEPLVVGSEVSINPVFTIVGIVAGEFLWGIPGMILAIPVMGILKIIFDHVESLKPFGFLMGKKEYPR